MLAAELRRTVSPVIASPALRRLLRPWMRADRRGQKV